MALSYESDKSKKPCQQAQSAPTSTTAPNQQRPMLSGYWGSQWRTPCPKESTDALGGSVAVAALLVAARKFTAAAGWNVATIALLVVKAICLPIEASLLEHHQKLVGKYHARFQRHNPGPVGLLVASGLFIFRTLILQYDIDMMVLMCDVHVWFWAAYWVEWWTGVSLSMGGDLGLFYF